MKKILPILILSLFLCHCAPKKEDRIIEAFRKELQKRNLEIISNDIIQITVRPNGQNTESLTVDLTEYLLIDNEDSVRTEIVQKADQIQKYFTLAEWNDDQSYFIPLIISKSANKSVETYQDSLTPNYNLSFNHQNTITHKLSVVGRNELSQWNKSHSEFKTWSEMYLNDLYLNESEFIQTEWNGHTLFMIKSKFELNANTLLFSKSFQQEASDKLGYPYFAILGKDLPAYVFNKKELAEDLKEHVLGQHSNYSRPIEILSFSQQGISIIQL